MRTLYFILFFMLPFLGIGQKKYTLEFQNDSYREFIKNPNTQFKDSTQAINYTIDLQNSAIAKGFLLASIDSIEYVSSKKSIVNFSLGPKFGSCSLAIDKNELTFINRHERINEKLITNLEFTPREVRSLLSKIHRAYLNNGYPFVAIQLDDQEIKNDQLKARINIKRGALNVWQKIHVKGDSSVSQKFISSLIDIHEGDLFDESKLKTNFIPRRNKTT